MVTKLRKNKEIVCNKYDIRADEEITENFENINVINASIQVSG